MNETPKLNMDSMRWEFRDGDRVLISFAWQGQVGGYVDDKGQSLGNNWKGAVVKARNLAERIK